jgi:ATP-dependent helicase/nuclease subunit A
LPPDARGGAAGRYLDWVAAHWDPAERAATVDEVLAVMADSRFAAVFGPGSRAEIEIAGHMATNRGVRPLGGRVDRIVVTPERVLIVDFKTNRPAPAALEDVPPDYLAQLAAYRRALAQLYPGRPVATALLWTDGPLLMEIPNSALDALEIQLFGRKPLP